MSHIQSLTELRNRLRADFSGTHRNEAVPWGNPKVMTEVLKQIQRDVGGDAMDKPDDNRLQKTLKSFSRKSRAIASAIAASHRLAASPDRQHRLIEIQSGSFLSHVTALFHGLMTVNSEKDA